MTFERFRHALQSAVSCAGERIGVTIKLKAGGSWIKLDPSGVRMGGSRINLGGGGGPGSGSGAATVAPELAIGVDAAGKPVQAERVKAQASEKKSTAAGLLPVTTPATPDDAPQTVDLSCMQSTFDELWGKSFPAGKSQEFGGTFVKDTTTGEYSIINTQGGTQGTFEANYTMPKDKEYVGLFHTPPL